MRGPFRYKLLREYYLTLEPSSGCFRPDGMESPCLFPLAAAYLIARIQNHPELCPQFGALLGEVENRARALNTCDNAENANRRAYPPSFNPDGTNAGRCGATTPVNAPARSHRLWRRQRLRALREEGEIVLRPRWAPRTRACHHHQTRPRLGRPYPATGAPPARWRPRLDRGRSRRHHGARGGYQRSASRIATGANTGAQPTGRRGSWVPASWAAPPRPLLHDVVNGGLRWAQCAQEASWGMSTGIHAMGDGAIWIAQQAARQFGAQGRYSIDVYDVCEYLAAAARRSGSKPRLRRPPHARATACR